jgi:tetratricopeptide (TPR) repeat protein
MNTLGVAQYRSGNWNAAAETLTKSMELAQGDLLSFSAFFLAMAHWQLGEKEKARDWYDKAATWMDGNIPDHEELGRFRAEAAELLGVEVTTVPTEPRQEKADEELPDQQDDSDDSIAEKPPTADLLGIEEQ